MVKWRARAAADRRNVTDTNRTTYLEVRSEAVRELFARAPHGPIVMLNLVRLRQVADYSATPAVAPTEPISGAAAFHRYIAETLPIPTRAAEISCSSGQGAAF